VVVKLAGSLIKGMHDAGMKCVGKHFPGHGFVAADSHLDLPVDERPLSDISQDMQVFKDLINHGHG
jgi:beta-N-acetylhexosaminidase